MISEHLFKSSCGFVSEVVEPPVFIHYLESTMEVKKKVVKTA